MAAFTGTPVSSTQYLYDSGVLSSSLEWRGQESVNSPRGLQIKRFKQYVHASANGAGTGTVKLGMLPAGRIFIIPQLCRLVTTQFAANADIHIGYAAHTDLSGATVSADDNAFYDNGDAGGGVLDVALTLPVEGLELNSREGIVIEAMIDTGNIETDDTISLMMAYIQA